MTDMCFPSDRASHSAQARWDPRERKSALSSARSSRRGARADAWGRAAETAVATQYEALGGAVLARRKRTLAGEIDLVVRINATLVIVEVKARRTTESALRAVSPKALRKLENAALICASEYGATDIRIDIAAMSGDGVVEIIENAGLAAAFA